jgi:ABC-type transporter Mla subunit MlaD
MTTERWTDDMLDRLVGSVANIAELTEQNTRNISQLESSVQGLVRITTQHQETLEQFQRNFDEAVIELRRQGADIRQMQVDVREMQAEVRGLQTENRRILDQLINQENNGN